MGTCQPCPHGFHLRQDGAQNPLQIPTGAASPAHTASTCARDDAQPCPHGFHLRQGRCSDVDECEEGTLCPHGLCENTPGSFRCDCARGFRVGPDGSSCHDVNECLEGEFCFPHGECLNTHGSFRCLCAPGYQTSADGTSCLDVDECQGGSLCAGGRCLNTEGSFECRCPAGFRSDPSQERCHDVDECQEYGASGLCGTQRCHNIPGSFRCQPQCQPGFHTGNDGECVDIDECSNGTLCGPHAACHNLPGSFQCACDPGYETPPHGHHCLDVDECETLRGVCGSERCENVEGSFLCLCRDSSHEFDPVTGRCGPPASLPETPGPRTPELGSCFSRACGVVAPNVTHRQCCCTLGWAWGTHCPPPRGCPAPARSQEPRDP
ncbi:latent-transforming growth factor beta-binding protein 2-like, partial [Myiozetetes cayanensis]|uniref:latent-transforming growth factor beta-binding protein 2-like n=1 Tax=Myiozetetes cayanensis TaxID=478635 RepID=UPI00215F370B